MCFRLLSYWVPRRYHQHFFLLLLTISLVLVYHIQKELFRPRLEHLLVYELEDIGFRDPNITCKFPVLHPFDPSILSHVRLATPIKCSSSYRSFMQIDENGFLIWNETALFEEGYSIDGRELICFYQEIFRPDGNDFDVQYGNQMPFDGNKTKLRSDFVYVECSINDWLKRSIYKDYLAKVQKLDGIRKYKEDELDVLVIGLDSVSKSNFMRQLPKSYKLLTKELGATVLIGFNKVGPNTFPNVVPMLTGRPLIPQPHHKFKEWPFIWKDFANVGAVTMYAEDQPHINMFDYLAEGIDAQPTSHYMHTYWLAAEQSLVRGFSARFCLGARPKHTIYFSYLKSFLKTYSQEPKFLFSLLNEQTHNYVNTVGVIDDVLTEFLNSSYHEGLFNRSVVLILGDHGNRIDSIRSTEIGKLEDSMPMVSIMLPPWVNASWRKSLKLNSNRLTSTFDLYATFVDVLGTLGGSPGKPGKSDKRIWDHFTQPPRGQTLFKEIPLTRDCEEAGIPDWHCVCNQDEEKIPEESAYAVEIATNVIGYINRLLKDLNKCATLQLKQVTWAVKNLKKKLVHITFSTEPNDGLFEAAVKDKENVLNVENIQRINPYGSQASCLPKEVLSNNSLYKAICYCQTYFL